MTDQPHDGPVQPQDGTVRRNQRGELSRHKARVIIPLTILLIIVGIFLIVITFSNFNPDSKNPEGDIGAPAVLTTVSAPPATAA